jgi:peptide/nickel transport system permease protein
MEWEAVSLNAQENYIIRNFYGGVQLVLQDRLTSICFGFLAFVLVLGLVGPSITPYQYDETIYTDNGELVRNQPPSLAHPFGTNLAGQDVLSRMIYGARPTVITGLVGGAMIVSIGLLVGVTAGYVGGLAESVLMRVTDIAYGVPLIPFAIVMLAILGISFYTSIAIIGLLLWRASARVLRSQVLQIKNRPFIRAAKATGASTPRIVAKHILPNIASMAILFFALGTGYSILIQANLSFIGVSNPFIPSWGVMIRNAYSSGVMADVWWWSLPPGLMIAFTVLSSIMLGRRYEVVAQGSEEGLVEMG